VSQRLPRSIQPPLLALQARQNLPLPPLLDPLDPDRGEVDRHAVLEPRAEQRVHVRVRGAVMAAVLMHGKDALDAPGGTTGGSLDGVTQNALGEVSIEPLEALRRGVVDGQDEAEVDRLPEAAPVLDEELTDGLLVALEGPVSRADPVQLAALSIGQSLFAMGDVLDLGARSLGA
jgi:hypothetical protein